MFTGRVQNLYREHNMSSPCAKVCKSTEYVIFYLYKAEFLKWNNPSSIFGTAHWHFLWTRSWSADGIESGQTARMYRLAWLYTGGKG